MENPNSDERKRRLSVPDDGKKKKKLSPSVDHYSEVSSPQPKKLIDQLYETWKSNVEVTNPPTPSQKAQNTEIIKKFQSTQAATKLARSSIELKLSELNIEKSKFEVKQRVIDREQILCLKMFNNAWESVNYVYEEMKSMVAVETSYDQKISDAYEIRSMVINKLCSEKEKLMSLPNDAVNLDREMRAENIELDSLMKLLEKFKKEDEKLQYSDQKSYLENMEKEKNKLKDIKDLYENLMEEEISLETDLQDKMNKMSLNDLKCSQDHQELQVKLLELQEEIKNLESVNETFETVIANMREIISKKLSPESFKYIDLTEELQNIKNRIKEYEPKLSAQDQRIESTNHLVILDSKLNEAKVELDSILMQKMDLKKLDELLAETNTELNLVLIEEVSKEIALANNEIEELTIQQADLNKDNIKILRELNESSKYDEEEQLIRDLKLELAQKEKVHNELMENYKKLKDENSKNLEENPNLLDTKDKKAFEELKIKLKADLTAATRKEISLDRKNGIKLKEFEQKAKKYQNLVKEVDQELISGEKKFEDLEKQIKDAEENLEKKQNAIKGAETKKEVELKRDAEKKKEADDKMEMELKEEAKRIKEAEIKKEAEKKKESELKKKALPVVIRNEPVQIDKETLSLIKSLKERLPMRPQTALSDTTNLIKKSPKRTDENLKPVSPLKNSADDVFSFKSSQSSQKGFDELFSQYKGNIRTQGTDKSPKKYLSLPNIIDHSEESYNILPIQTSKSELKERQKPSERKFFKSASQSAPKSKRSKSVPVRKV